MNIEILNTIFNQVEEKKKDSSVNLKICGSYGIYLNSPYLKKHLKENKLISSSDHFFIQNYSSPRDIDFIAPFAQKTLVKELFFNLGFQSNKSLESIPGIKRHVFSKPYHKVDVFYDTFDFNHKINMSQKINNETKRIQIGKTIIPITELLLQKLQIVEIGKKDLVGAWWLLKGHQVFKNSDEGINLSVLEYYLSNDWGFYYTVTNNLRKLITIMNEVNIENLTLKKVKNLLYHLETARKSIKWKIRSKIGTKIKWYTEVDNI